MCVSSVGSSESLSLAESSAFGVLPASVLVSSDSTSTYVLVSSLSEEVVPFLVVVSFFSELGLLLAEVDLVFVFFDALQVAGRLFSVLEDLVFFLSKDVSLLDVLVSFNPFFLVLAGLIVPRCPDSCPVLK